MIDSKAKGLSADGLYTGIALDAELK